jgi:hypothetical protein
MDRYAWAVAGIRPRSSGWSDDARDAACWVAQTCRPDKLLRSLSAASAKQSTQHSYLDPSAYHGMGCKHTRSSMDNIIPWKWKVCSSLPNDEDQPRCREALVSSASSTLYDNGMFAPRSPAYPTVSIPRVVEKPTPVPASGAP